MPSASPSAPPTSAPSARSSMLDVGHASCSELQMQREMRRIEQAGHIFDRPPVGGRASAAVCAGRPCPARSREWRHPRRSAFRCRPTPRRDREQARRRASVWCSEPSRRPLNGTSSSSGESGSRLRSMEMAWPSPALLRSAVDGDEGRVARCRAAPASSASSITSSRSVRVSALAPASASARDQPIGVIDRLAVEGDEGADADLGGDQAAAGEFLQPLADGVAADGKALDEFVLALQPVTEAEHAGADLLSPAPSRSVRALERPALAVSSRSARLAI